MIGVTKWDNGHKERGPVGPLRTLTSQLTSRFLRIDRPGYYAGVFHAGQPVPRLTGRHIAAVAPSGECPTPDAVSS